MATIKTVRGIDDAVFTEAKASAVRAKKSLGQYITEALTAKNRKEAKR